LQDVIISVNLAQTTKMRDCRTFVPSVCHWLYDVTCIWFGRSLYKFV